MTEGIPDNPFSIPNDCEVLLVCEGKSDAAFLRAMSEHMGLTTAPKPIGSKSEFRPSKLKNIKLDPNFPKLRGLGMVLDADNSADQALAKVNEVLRIVLDTKPNFLQHGRIKPLESEESPSTQVGAFIMPDGENPGALEDLLLRSVRESHPEIMVCVDEFQACADQGTESNSRKKSKQSMQTFLSGLAEYYPYLSVALREHIIDLNRDAFADLRNFLQALSAT